jgi:hypothetical protein
MYPLLILVHRILFFLNFFLGNLYGNFRDFQLQNIIRYCYWITSSNKFNEHQILLQM